MRKTTKTKNQKGLIPYMAKFLIWRLWQKGYNAGDTHDFLFDYLNCYVSKAGISQKYMLFKAGTLDYEPNTDQEKDEANIAIDVIAKLKEKFAENIDTEIDRAMEAGKMIDQRVMEKVDQGTLADASLVKASQDFFNRRQILFERPTSISKNLNGLTDEELIKKLTKTGYIEPEDKGHKKLKQAAAIDISGTSKTETRRTDKVLDTSRKTTPSSS